MLLTPLRPELLIRVPRLGRLFVLVPVVIPVLGGLLVVLEVEEALDEAGKVVPEVLSEFEEVRLGKEGADPLPRPAICALFGVAGAKSNSFWSIASCFDDGPVVVLVLWGAEVERGGVRGLWGIGYDSGGIVFRGTGIEFDVEEVSMKALPSFPGEEFELQNEEEPEELRDGGFSSLSWNLCEDDALKEASKGLVGTCDCAARDLGLRLKAGRRPPLPPVRLVFPLSLFPPIDSPKLGFRGVVAGVELVVDGGKERGSEDSEPVRRCVDDGTAKERSSRR